MISRQEAAMYCLRDTNPALLGSPIPNAAQPWSIVSRKGTNVLDEGAHAGLAICSPGGVDGT